MLELLVVLAELVAPVVAGLLAVPLAALLAAGADAAGLASVELESVLVSVVEDSAGLDPPFPA